MTTVRMEDQGGVLTMQAKGHATGSPEVCAAISALLYALAGYLINARDDGRAKEIESHMGGGDVLLRYSGGDDVVAAYQTIQIGLLQLEKAFPEFIQVV